MIWRSGLDAKCDYFNQAWLDFRGRRMTEELGDGWLAGVHPSDVQRCMATYLTAFKAREPFEMEYRLRRHDGQYRWVVDRGRPFLDRRGQFAGYIGLCNDETERKRSERALRDSEEQFRVMAETVPEIVFTNTPDGSCDFLNQRFYECTGLPPGSGTGFGWARALHPDDAQKATKRWAEAVDTGRAYEDQYRLVLRDGTHRWFMARARPVRDADGKIVKWFGVSTEINDLVRAREAVQASEERLTLALDATSEGIWDWNIETGHVFFSPRWFTSLGYAPGELPPHVRSWEALVHPEDMSRVREALAAHFDGRTPIYECVNRLRTKSGAYRWNLDRGKVVARDREGRPLRMVGVDADITERKLAEDELRESQITLSNITDAVPGAVYQYVLHPSGDQHFLYLSRGVENMMGLTRDEALRDFQRVWSLTCPEDVDPLWRSIQESARSLQPWSHEFRVVLDGQVKWLWGSSVPESPRPDGSIVWNGILFDVTEQKRAEDTIMRLQRQAQLLLNSAGEGVYGLDRDGLTTFVNPAAARMLGYEPDELIGRHMHRTIHHSREDGSVYEQDACPIHATLNDGEPRRVSLDVMWRKDGSRLEVDYAVTPIRENARLTGCVITFRDVSERRRAGRALRESHERFELVSRATNDAIWDWDLQTNHTWWNPHQYEMLGYRPEQVLPGYEAWKARLHPDDRQRVVTDFEAALASDVEVWAGEYRYTTGDGSYRYAMDRALIQRGPDGRPTRVIGAMTDMTDRKVAERGLAAKVRQQAALSTLGQLALSGVSLQTLFDETARRLAETLQIELVKILLLDADKERFLLQAGVGWDEGCVGRVNVPIQPDSQAGFALHANEPVIVEDLRTETRFGVPALLASHGATSGISVPIRSDEGSFGVIGAHARSPRAFAPEDAHFLQNVANVLGNAIARSRAEEVLQHQTAQLQAITESMASYLVTGDWKQASGRIVRAALDLTGSEYGYVGAVVEGPVLHVLAHEGMTWHGVENRAFYEDALRTYEQRGHLEFRNLDTLFGRVITEKRTVLSNDPAADPRAAGLPPGHPPLRHFLGVPVMRGSEVVGMIGIANKAGGYAPSDETKLMVLANAAGVLYENYRQRQREAALDAARRQAEDDLRAAQQRLLERQRLEKEQVEAELDKARETLVRQTRLAALGQLSGSVAHELRNPLGSIRNALYLLKRRLPVEDRKSEAYLTMAEEEVETANRTIQDLLALSGGKQAIKEEVDLSVLLEDAVRRVKVPDAVTWALRADISPFLVKADPMQLRQVLVNLLQNAVQATKGRGHIDVQARRSPEHDIVRITDTGPGVPEAVRARLFEPLFTTKAKGTGLGLTICRQIMERHGGTIDFEAPPGGGARFRIQLPIEQPGQ